MRCEMDSSRQLKAAQLSVRPTVRWMIGALPVTTTASHRHGGTVQCAIDCHQ